MNKLDDLMKRTDLNTLSIDVAMSTDVMLSNPNGDGDTRTSILFGIEEH